MVKKVGKYEIPFDKDGNQMHYPTLTWDGSYDAVGKLKPTHPETRPNTPFMDTLTFTGSERGRSAAYFKFTRTNGTTVCFFMKEMEEIIPLMTHGTLTGTFQHVKRGQNFGTALVTSGD